MSMGENKASGLERGYDRGSGKALRCEWVYPDGMECGGDIGYGEGDEWIEAWVWMMGPDGTMAGLWACSEYRDMVGRLKVLAEGNVRRVMGCSETGRQVWDRNYFYALGRMRGQEERR